MGTPAPCILIQMEGQPRVNQRVLARACGVSTATISRALAGHPSVRESLRARIVAKARELGYRSDPRLAYLSRLRWAGGRSSSSVRVVALVDRYTGADRGEGKFEPLEATARRLGYEIEYLMAEEALGRGRQLSRSYFHRGIGALLIALHGSMEMPDFDWDRFSVVIVGEEYPQMPFYRVGTDWRQGFDLMSAKLQALGGSVGFALYRYPEAAGRELDRLIHAEALLLTQELGRLGLCRAPIFEYSENDAGAGRRFAEWLREHGIDVVCSNSAQLAAWLEGAAKEVEKRRPLFCIPCSSEARRLGIGGCGLQLGKRLSLGLEVLHENLLLDRRGLAEMPIKHLLPMVWLEEGSGAQSRRLT